MVWALHIRFLCDRYFSYSSLHCRLGCKREMKNIDFELPLAVCICALLEVITMLICFVLYLTTLEQPQKIINAGYMLVLCVSAILFVFFVTGKALPKKPVTAYGKLLVVRLWGYAIGYFINVWWAAELTQLLIVIPIAVFLLRGHREPFHY